MSGIFTAIIGMANVIETMNKAYKDPNEQNINDVLNAMHDGVKGSQFAESKGSITKFLGKYTVEPVIIASKGAKEEEIFERVVGMNTDIFCSFYLQAFEILTGIQGYTANIAIDVLSTNRGDMFQYIQAGGNQTFNQINDMVNSINRVTNLSWNSIDKDRNQEDTFNYMRALMSKTPTLSLSLNTESTLDVEKTHKRTSVNMAVNPREGLTDAKEMTNSLYASNFRLLKVTVDIDYSPKGKKDKKIKRTIVIPIQVRAHVIVADINDIANMLTPKSIDKTFASRFMEWRSGGISFQDLVFCGDLIREYKANRIGDKQNLLGKLVQKEISAGSSQAGDRFEKHYNMYIITKDDKLLLDRRLRGDLSGEKCKQQFLTAGLGLGLTILDPDYERVEMSIKDIRGQSTTSYKHVKKLKGDENNYEKIMQALLMNRPMAF